LGVINPFLFFGASYITDDANKEILFSATIKISKNKDYEDKKNNVTERLFKDEQFDGVARNENDN